MSGRRLICATARGGDRDDGENAAIAMSVIILSQYIDYS
jgi:hypothetical protein